ncbi:DUF4870 family protein [Burkholderia sp. 22PA0099]|uniref:DUF4870 family protein n=1 Tax=unclassified Burkholderia TaxID=2613784 RepID=UPI0039C1B77C
MTEPSVQPGGVPAPVNFPGGRSAGERERSLKTLTHVLYALYALQGFTGGFTALVAIIINYVKREDVVGTHYQAHFEWQIRTFWRALILAAIGFLLVFVVVGFFILGAAGIWCLYRIIKGWLYLYDEKPLDPKAWF